MADRYLVGTGNWNSTSVWSATSGGASGASVPTSIDVVYLNANYTVTLNGDAECSELNHTNGTLSLSSYRLSCGVAFQSYGSTARTVNLQNGILEVTLNSFNLNLAGSNLTFNAGNSLVILNIESGYGNLNSLSKVFNDVRINLGSASNSVISYITGSPTFRLLDIRSANSAAHTVNFDSDISISQKFVGIGSSSSNRLKLTGRDFSPINFNFTAGNDTDNLYSCYGENLDVEDIAPQTVYEEDAPESRLYIGSSSIKNWTGTSEWVLSNSPKISTLIDPLTTAPGSNSNWTTYSSYDLPSLTNTGYNGGGYNFDASGGKGMVSTDTFDLYDSEVIFEFPETVTAQNLIWYVTSLIYPQIYGLVVDTYIDAMYETLDVFHSASSVSGPPQWIKIGLTSSRVFRVAFSSDGSTWSSYENLVTIPEEYIPLLRSNRIQVYKPLGTGSGLTLGSVNSSATPPEPEPPTVTTQSVTSIGETTATGNGTVVSDGNSTITERGVCWNTSTNPTTANSKATSAGTTGAYTASMTSLTHSTLYYVRAYAINAEGTSYGDNVTFTTATPPTAPTVTTGSVTDIGTTTATGNGNVTNDGGATITERGVCWNTAPSPTTSNSKATSAGTTGSFSASMTGLNDDTTYYVRAYAINSVGTSYGSQVDFTTDEIPPDVYITQQNGRLLKQQNGRGLIL